jgi:hypothetical protein
MQLMLADDIEVAASAARVQQPRLIFWDMNW